MPALAGVMALGAPDCQADAQSPRRGENLRAETLD